MQLPDHLPLPLDHPLAVASGGAAMVVAVRWGGAPLPLGIGLGVAVSLAGAALGRRRRPASRSLRRHDRRLNAGIEAALDRAAELVQQVEAIRGLALERFTTAEQLEALGLVQLCCDRLAALPERLQRHRSLLESGGGVLPAPEILARRLAEEEKRLRGEPEGPLHQQRRRLVEQLRHNLEAARLGFDEREARLLTLATGLEAVEGGLRHLRQRIDRHWPGSEVPAPSLAAAIDPLEEALDRIDALLGEARL